MAWGATFPVGPGFKWNDPAFLRQFYDAVDERYKALLALGCAGGVQWVAARPLAGARIGEFGGRPGGMDATHYDLRALQEVILTDFPAWFLNLHDYGGGLDGQVGPGHGAMPAAYTTATLLAAAGLNSGGFTRHLADGTVAYGFFETGDQPRPHVFNELYAVLNLLTSIAVPYFGWTDPDGSRGATPNLALDPSPSITMPAAVAVAVAAASEYVYGAGTPYAQWTATTSLAGGWMRVWEAGLARGWAKGSIYMGSALPCNIHADWYQSVFAWTLSGPPVLSQINDAICAAVDSGSPSGRQWSLLQKFSGTDNYSAGATSVVSASPFGDWPMGDLVPPAVAAADDAAETGDGGGWALGDGDRTNWGGVAVCDCEFTYRL